MHVCPRCSKVMRQFAFDRKTCWVCPYCGHEKMMENSEYYDVEYMYFSSVVLS